MPPSLHDIRPPAQKDSRDRKKNIFSISLEETSNQSSQIALFVTIAAVLIALPVLAFILSQGLRLQNIVEEAASRGLQQFLQGVSLASQDKTAEALEAFDRALNNFQKANREVWFFEKPESGSLDRSQESVKSFLNSGALLSETASGILQTLERIKKLPSKFFFINQKPYVLDIAGTNTTLEFTDELAQEFQNLETAFRKISQIEKELNRISQQLLPYELREPFAKVKQEISGIIKILQEFSADLPAFLKLLGHTEPHRILLLFQNNNEIRATGGFIGSYAVIEFEKGFLQNLEVFDSYQTDRNIQEIIPPPDELRAVSKKWGFRDSNYSAHFPFSAEKALWFLKKAGKEQPQTVIAVDTEILQPLLIFTGPVQLSSLPAPFTAENVITVLNYFIESKFFGKENPKQIMKDLVPTMQKKIFLHHDSKALSGILLQLAQEKHITGYSRDHTIQNLFVNGKIAGLVQQDKKKNEPSSDFLHIVHTSLGGNKSDALIQETVQHNTYFSKEKLENEVIIERHHQWTPNNEDTWRKQLEPFEVKEISPAILDVLGRGRNLVATRVYLPKGSQLEKNQDTTVTLRYDKEIGLPYVSFNMQTSPGNKTVKKFRYQLPWKVKFNPLFEYRLRVLKQAGSKENKFIKRIFPEASMVHVSNFPKEETYRDTEGAWVTETTLTTDKHFASLWRE